MAGEKRKYPRTGSHNLVSYVCRDEKNNVVCEGMGRTLNVSEGGILLETHDALDTSDSISLTVALEDELMDLEGRVAFSNKRADGNYETGIQFRGFEEKKIRFLRQFITIFAGESHGIE
ncbi:MAG: PilZ domain-containing protein [Desulfobacteraceae bacterium]|nr:MAG: PilZ domain-containing protein [Desulfobacteraceae bacterium]